MRESALRSALYHRPTETLPRHVAEEAPGWSLPQTRRHAVVDLADSIDPEPAHGKQVAMLALALFDASQEIHGLGPLDRELLEYAALLHDVGASVNRAKHNRHSRYLILNAPLPGFDREEIRWIATIARFHRGAPPKPNQGSLAAFEPEARRRILGLIAILRIADALDRSHQSLVRRLRLVREKNSVEIELDASGGKPILELWGAQRRADLWQRCFDVEVGFRLRAKRHR